MSTIGEVAVRAYLDDKDLDKGIDAAEKKSGKFSKTLGTVTKGVAAVGTAGIAAGGALLAMANKTGGAADEIDKMSIRTGISRKQLQELQFAASQTGVSFGAIESASARVSMTLRTNEEAFNDMGVATRNAAGELVGTDEIFNETILKLAEMENETERNILGTELFGRGFSELIPLIDAGSDGIQGYADRAHELGLVMSDDAIAANVQFMDSMDEVKRTMGAAFATIMTDILPILQSFLDWLMANMPQIQETFRVVMNFISEAVRIAFSVFNEYALPVLKQAFDFIKDILASLQDFWDKWGTQITDITVKLFNYIQGFIEGVFKVIEGIFNVFIGLITGDWRRMGEGISQIWSGLWLAIENIIKGAATLLVNALKVVGRAIMNWFSTITADARQWGKNMIQGFIDGILGMIGKVGGAAKKVFNAAKDFLGFGSPAKKGDGRFIVKYGENMIDGFIEGIQNAIPDLNNVMQSSFAIPQGQSTTNNFGGVTVQSMSVRSDNDIKLIARELDSLSRSRSRGLGY